MKKSERTEYWEKVPGLPDYSVSIAGRVRRDTPGPGTRPGLLKPYMTSSGLSVKLPNLPPSMLPRGRQSTAKFRTIAVARLMAYTFLGRPLHAKAEVRYKDGDRTNLELSNLAWSPGPLSWLNLQRRRRQRRPENPEEQVP